MMIKKHFMVTIEPAMIAAVFAVVIAIAINVAAPFAAPASSVLAAMDKGHIESRTPYDLAPWWLKTRAQADCSSVQGVFQSGSSAIDAALSPRFLSDQLGNARPCEVLAGYLTQPNSERIGKRSDSSGLNAAGSLSLLIVKLIGWRGTVVLHLAILLSVVAAAVFIPRRWRSVQFSGFVPAVSLALSAIVLAVPGSITLLPVMVVLIVLAMLPIFRQRYQRVAIILPACCAAALCVLDPRAASAVAGLTVLMAALVSKRGHEADDLVPPVLSYVFAATITQLFYLVLAVLFAKPGTSTFVTAFIELFGDRSVQPWPFDIPAAIVKVYQWIGDGPMYFRSLAFIFCWTALFVVVAGDRFSPSQAEAEGKSRQHIAARLPLVPVLAWILIYPGLLRRSPDSYVLLIVSVGMLVVIQLISLRKGQFRAGPDGSALPPQANLAEAAG